MPRYAFYGASTIFLALIKRALADKREKDHLLLLPGCIYFRTFSKKNVLVYPITHTAICVLDFQIGNA